jgi:hypothetical protein
VLKGEDCPTTAAEKLEFADICRQYFAQCYLTATRLYADAFRAMPELADDLQSENRYNAARAAALAAAGLGEDAAKLDDRERARLRNQAWEWLRADIVLWTKEVQSNELEDHARLRWSLQHWQNDGELSALREPRSLANLPQAEREAWLKLWSDVAAVIAKARTARPQEMP